MKVGIMQPYIFPYIGYFQLINHVDKWIVFDDTQYISKGWINRNRILHPETKKEWQYFTIPIKKHPKSARINEVETNNTLKWKDEIFGKLTCYQRKAPHYSETLEFVRDCLNLENSTFSEFITNILVKTCNHIGIDLNLSVFSQMDLDHKNIKHAGQWALEITDHLRGNEYINPPGGYEIFNEGEFTERGINLNFLKPKLIPYVQRRDGFVPGLSIIDVLMWNDRNKILEMLRDYDIVTHSMLRTSNHE